MSVELPKITKLSMLRRLLALSAGTFKEAIRLRVLGVTVIFAFFVLFMTPYLPSDGSPEGALKLTITVCLGSASALAIFASLALSVLIPAQGKKLHTDFMVAIRPVPRSVFFLARVLGISGVIATLIFIMGLSSGIFIYLKAANQPNQEAQERAMSLLTMRTKTPPVFEDGSALFPETGPKEQFVLQPNQKVVWSFSLPPSVQFDGTIPGRLAAKNTTGLKLATEIFIFKEDGSIERKPHTCTLNNVTTPHIGEYFEFEFPKGAILPPERKGLPATTYLMLQNTSSEPRTIERSPLKLMFGRGSRVSPKSQYHWIVKMPADDSRPLFIVKFHLSNLDKTPPKLEMLSRNGILYETFPVVRPNNTAIIHPPANLALPGELVTFRLTNKSIKSVGIPTKEGLVIAKITGSFSGAIVGWMLSEFAKCLFIISVTCAGAAFLTFPIPALLGGVMVVGSYLVSFVSQIVAGKNPTVWSDAFSGILRTIMPDLANMTTVGSIASSETVPLLTIMGWIGSLLIFRCLPWCLFGIYLQGKKELAE